MTRARATLVSVEDTPYYHCIGRCVRRAFLCGFDEHTQRSYEHRRVWMRERLSLLCETFAIDVCAYTLLSNHYHLVVRLAPVRAQAWSKRDIIERWARLFQGTSQARRFLNNDTLDETETRRLDADIEKWQCRLGDLSWFMRCFNEFIARKANAEDACTGHFWESRFKSQALLDDTALITAMAYVDLNPVRAKLADSIETSDFTSGQDRLREVTAKQHPLSRSQRPHLLPFMETETNNANDYLPFNLKDYLELIDTTGRVIVQGKRGFIAGDKPRLIHLLSINGDRWVDTVMRLQQHYELAIGSPERLRRLAVRWGKRWLRGIGRARGFYLEPGS